MISTIYEELTLSSKPVARALHKSSDCKTICIGFNKGMELKKHKTNVQTTLLVINGSIEYLEEGKVIQLSTYDQLDIPIGIVHAVMAKADSLILLIQG